MDKLRVGIVGSKFAATLHAECYRRNNKVETVAVAALDDLEEFAARFHIPHTYEEFHSLGYVSEIDYFVDCILNDREPKFGVSGAGGLACMQVVEGFYRSATEGRTIKVGR